MECTRCHQPRRGFRLFCDCGLLWDRSELRQVRFATDETRGRALDEIYAKVEAGREETQRDAEAKLESEVYEHYRQIL